MDTRPIASPCAGAFKSRIFCSVKKSSLTIGTPMSAATLSQCLCFMDVFKSAFMTGSKFL